MSHAIPGSASQDSPGLRYDQLTAWRANHPAWRLLTADNAAMILSFMWRAFLEPNIRILARPELVDALEDHLATLREVAPDAYPRSADQYIDEWSNPRKDHWLRRTHPSGEENPLYEPTAAVELAAAFCRDLAPRRFVGTASRLLTVTDLIRQIVIGADTNPASRIAALEAQRADIETQLAQIRAGVDTRMDSTAVRERYEQARATARDLRSDLRAVSESFRNLDRDVRAKAAMWDGPRGGLLEEVFGSARAIDETDQGRSWTAFWEYLLDRGSREELARLLEAVERVEALAGYDREVERVLRTELFDAAEGTQRTVASLSAQLRRFLEDEGWAENRRIGALMRRTLAAAARAAHDESVSDNLPGSATNAFRADVSLPAERPLYVLRSATDLDTDISEDEVELDLSELAEMRYIDLPALRDAVDTGLRHRGGVASLTDILDDRPLTDGLAELVGYLQVGAERDAEVLSARERVPLGPADPDRAIEMPSILFGAHTPTVSAATTSSGTVPAATPDHDLQELS